MVKVNIKDIQFTTDSLKWSGKDELLSTIDRVRFTGDKFLIEGEGLSAKIKDQKMKILDNVKGNFLPLRRYGGFNNLLHCILLPLSLKRPG